MPPLLMAGFDRQHLPTRTLREAARQSEGALAQRVSTGAVRAWDLFELRASAMPGAAAWAEKTLDAIVASAVERYREKVDCPDCIDLGFYGLTSAEDPDLLTGLLRREGDGGYEQLVAGAWAPYTSVWDQRLEILDEELAGDLAEALTAGASGLMRRFYWPKAFLPPQTMTVTVEAVRAFTAAAAPAEGTDGASAAKDAKSVETAQAEAKVTAGPADGWTEYAVVDDLDPGAVLNLIRLAPGPELADYENGTWTENPDLLSRLQGVSPPPLVELDQDQLTNVMSQMDASKSAAAPAATTAAAPGALVAGDKVPLTVSPDPRAEKLRRYWTTGKGGIKVRWGTKGDWTRCYRHLSKFMGTRAKGYCQNLHKRATGVWTGNKLNPGGNGHHGGRTAAGAPRPALSLEAALVASMSTGSWLGPDGSGDKGMTLKDGVYAEAGENVTLLRTLTAGGFPVNPPDEWFANPQLEGPTPLTVDDDGRVFGHIATFDVAHIGLPGRVHAPKSRSDYAYFKTGQLVTASGAKINVGQLTLSGGHAPLNADASAAVAHYDNTASSVCDLNIGEDRYGIWVAGATRPEVTPQQLRTLRASAPSGDWRPINGHLELVACCQVNVPGFPVARARVASGAITALVAAGARPLAARKLALLADAELAARIAELENFVYGNNTESLVGEPDMGVAADGAPGEGVPAVVSPELEAEVESALTLEPQGEGEVPPVDTETPAEPQVSDAVKRAREQVAARRADIEARRASLRERVHGRVPVAADGAPPFTKKKADSPVSDNSSDSASAVEDPGDDGDGDVDGVGVDTGSDGDGDFAPTNPEDYAAPLPGLSDEAIHAMLAQKQGISDLSHGDAVQSLHGDYQGDAKKMAADLGNGKVKKPKKAGAKAAAPAAPAVPAGLGNV